MDRNLISAITSEYDKMVALRKESVDRNTHHFMLKIGTLVALRKESVDRNNGIPYSAAIRRGRSPQGERG